MEKLLVQCAWCGRVRIDGCWRFSKIDSRDECSHGICPVCKVEFLQEISEYQKHLPKLFDLPA